MYPAYSYDAAADSGLIKHDDLPDVMFGGGTQYNKIQPVEIFETRYGVYLDPTSPNEENEGYIYWNSEGGSFGPTWSAFAEGGRNCLVEDLFNNGFWLDNFADTYTITTPFSSGIVERRALCIWNGVDGNGCRLQLLYGGFGGDPETEPAESSLGWSVEFQKYEEPEGLPAGCTVNYGRLKSGFQNSPIGTYDISYTSAGSESATVS